MLQVSILRAAVGCLLGFSSFFVSGSPVARSYTIVEGPIHWRGVLEEGGGLVYLFGDTFEEIEAKAKALNPAYSIFNNFTAPLNARDGLNTRRTQVLNCGSPAGWTPSWNQNAVYEGIQYLRGLTGDCRGAPGPGACERVSCSGDSAILYCNDNPYEIWEPCRWIGDVAEDIAYQCNDNGRTLGQAFDLRRGNTIVAAVDC